MSQRQCRWIERIWTNVLRVRHYPAHTRSVLLVTVCGLALEACASHTLTRVAGSDVMMPSSESFVQRVIRAGVPPCDVEKQTNVADATRNRQLCRLGSGDTLGKAISDSITPARRTP